MNQKRSRPFVRFAKALSTGAGRPATFAAAVALIVIWAVSGPVFGFSDTWQLVINTSTTIITFLMVFLIQHTQNRDTEAIQLKLDEIIRSVHGARNDLIDLEDQDDEELELARKHFADMAEKARTRLEHRASRAKSRPTRDHDESTHDNRER
ncbi:MAG TPA: low affinity iron permease family protein [Gemmatimonadaceae bacterium]|nr:low affinity iron permease family protein [Gemmatimonadaceae bacterium]